MTEFPCRVEQTALGRALDTISSLHQEITFAVPL